MFRQVYRLWAIGLIWLTGVDAALAQRAVVGLHQAELESHRLVATSPDLVGSTDAHLKPLRLPRTLAAERPCRTVFGLLPYWESAANIRWDHLTHVAAFAVEVNVDGTLGDDHGWPWTNLINTAHSHGVKVVLCATLFDPDGIETLITTPQYKDAFFRNIKNKMLQGTTDGINIDFEGNGDFVNFINPFMAELTEYMHSEVPGSEVTFDGPPVNWAGWDLPGLAASCDGIFIMGYAFAGSWSTRTGANAPLTGGSINITDTLLDEYAPLAITMPEKLILGVPYYGGHWITETTLPNAAVVTWQGSTRFRDDGALVQQYGRQWDPVSQTPWYYWIDDGDVHQVWYDDSESLGLKWQLAQDHDLQGVGMWALNYDGARSELWDELGARFIDACPADDVDTTGVSDDADACNANADCDDGDACTLDQCSEGACTNVAIQGCDATTPGNEPDDDGDGVVDALDLCGQTPAGETVDDDGCSASQLESADGQDAPSSSGRIDSDGDSVADEFDLCPDTSSDVDAVDADGCPVNRPSPTPVAQDSTNSSATGCGAMGIVNLMVLSCGICCVRRFVGRGDLDHPLTVGRTR